MSFSMCFYLFLYGVKILSGDFYILGQWTHGASPEAHFSASKQEKSHMEPNPTNTVAE